MIHSMPAFNVGNPIHAPGGKVGKGGIEAAIAAMFGEALAAQIKTGDVGAVASDAADTASLSVGQAAQPALAQGDTADAGILLDEAVVATDETVMAEGEAAQDSGQISPGVPVALPNEAVAQGAGGEEGEPTVGLVPAAYKNPNVAARGKELPVTPAGFAANARAFDPKGGGELPPGLQRLMASTEGAELKSALQATDAPGRVAVVGGELPPEAARPVQAQVGLAGVQATAHMEPQVGVRQFAHLATPMTQPQWQAEFGDKIAWMALRQAHVAELSLNPPSLGSIEVRLNVSGQEAGAQFFSANPVVREAIEAALPRLREMMAEAGLALGQAMVSSESFREREAQAQAEDGRGEGQGGEGRTVGLQEANAVRTYRLVGLVDEFA